jgi:hypothetical protein
LWILIFITSFFIFSLGINQANNAHYVSKVILHNTSARFLLKTWYILSRESNR